MHIGLHRLSARRGREQQTVRRVRRLKMHRLYDAVTTDYDVALIEMDREIEYAPEIRPICLLLPEEEGDVDYTGDY